MEKNLIGIRLKKLRKEQSLTQQAFADEIGVSASTICDIEKGRYIPGGEFLLSLQRRFSMSIDWFLTGKNCPHDVLMSKLHPDGIKMLEEVVRLPEEQRAWIRKYFLALIEHVKGNRQIKIFEIHTNGVKQKDTGV